MPFDSIVCVKQVPDTANVTAEAMKDDGTVNRSALPTIFNPDDLDALEAALRLRDQHGGTVTVLTMGPPKAGDILRDCLSRGADRAILLTDRRAAASDTLATSYILSQAVRTIGRYDVVFCGRQAIDGDTAQVGPQCAEKLGLPQVTYLEDIVSASEQSIRIRRNIGHGWEIVEGPLPVLVTVMGGAMQPRPPAVRRLMRVKRMRTPAELAGEIRAEMSDASDDQRETELASRVERLKEKRQLIEQWDLDAIGAELSRCGLAGSPTKVHRIQAIVLKKEGYTQVPPTETGVRELIHGLIVDRTLG